MFEFLGGNQPSNTTVSGYGGAPFLDSEAAISNHLSSIGQTSDSVTGITGRTAQEVYDKYKAQGASQSQLQDLVHRIGRF